MLGFPVHDAWKTPPRVSALRSRALLSRDPADLNWEQTDYIDLQSTSLPKDINKI